MQQRIDRLSTLTSIASTNGFLQLWTDEIDPNARTSRESTLLHAACRAGNLQLAKFLISKGASVKERDTAGYTPLLSVAGSLPSRNAIMEYLLFEAGSSITEETNGQTAFLSACRVGNLMGASWLLSKGGSLLTERDKNGNSALLLASWAGEVRVVQWLLNEAGADPNDKDKSGFNALHLAACNGRLAVVQFLVFSNKLHVKETDARGYTALLLAAANGHLDTVRWLIQKGGATVDENTRGQTALLSAARGGHISVVDWLLREGGAHITETDTGGHTALLFAARYNRVAMVKWLLEHGGATLEESANGYTALLLAASNDNLEMVEFLVKEMRVSVKQSLKGQTALLSAARSGHLRMVQWLLKHAGSSFDEVDMKGNTALLMAAWSGHFDLVQWLLREGGAKITETDYEGNTVLHLAVWRSNLSLIEWLIKSYRSDVRVLNKRRQSPLELASISGPPSNPFETVRLLLRFGAGLCCKNLTAIVHNLQQSPNTPPEQEKLQFKEVVLIGSDLSPTTPGFQDCIFDARRLRSALLCGADIDRWVLQEVIPDLLDHQGPGASVKVDKQSHKILENIRDDGLAFLLPGNSLMNICLNHLNTTLAGRKVLDAFLLSRGCKLGEGKALPRDIEERLRDPHMTDEEEARLRERERERNREVEKYQVYGRNLNNKPTHDGCNLQ